MKLGYKTENMALTPMMRQYFEIKEQAKDALLFFRLGDFYEMFADDAVQAAELLGITLTARNKGENKIPMCGVPYHSAAGYIAKLTRAGKKVAICEQVSDPSLAGIVKREIVRIVTPGTTLDENVLEERTSNFLAAICYENAFGMALAELSTGEFFMLKAPDINSVMAELEKYKPGETIWTGNDGDGKHKDILKKHFQNTFWHDELLEEEFLEKAIEHFGFNDQKASLAEIKASAMILKFLEITQKTSAGKNGKLGHLDKIEFLDQENFLALDEATIRNLEILQNAREKKTDGSLLSIMDKTVTSSGGRMLKKVLVRPLAKQDQIEKRLNLIEALLKNQNLLLDLRLKLKNIADLERILGRLTLGSGNARDLRGLINSYRAAAEIKSMITATNNQQLFEAINGIELLEELIDELNRAIVEDAPFSIREGGMIGQGFDQELDYYKNISKDGKGFIAAMQTREIARTGINSLKVKFNKVFGYYIEISNANLGQVPADYTRKQTLANAERFSTPELKEYEEKVLGAEEKIFDIELKIYEKLRSRVLEKTLQIKQTATILAGLDVMCCFALISWENNYVRPRIHPNFDLMIRDGRHPVIEKLNPQDKFVPNDTVLTESKRLSLITGPNMGGKSTYLRQTALLVLMAHLGMYVPAKEAIIPLVDRIFTRVGASDNLVRGQSTFWLEMEETALILKQATEKSLLVLDEIGRGTSTYDGVSIAWGIMEYLHDQIRAKTLFASHYHELIGLAESLDLAENLCVKVEENQEKGVIFLYKLDKGGIDKSYGIEVAKLAGLPMKVIERAKMILHELENEKPSAAKLTMKEAQPINSFSENQRVHLGLEKLRQLDVDNLTPLEALNRLHELKNLSQRHE